jgi:hypothetical protein
MQLYDVFYKGRAMDCDVPLPPAAPDIDRVVNTNWDHRTLRPVKVGGSYDWTREIVTRKLYAPTGISSTSPEGQSGTLEALGLMRLISSERKYAWGPVATVIMRVEDEETNRAALLDGWRLEA